MKTYILALVVAVICYSAAMDHPLTKGFVRHMQQLNVLGGR